MGGKRRKKRYDEVSYYHRAEVTSTPIQINYKNNKRECHIPLLPLFAERNGQIARKNEHNSTKK